MRWALCDLPSSFSFHVAREPIIQSIQYHCSDFNNLVIIVQGIGQRTYYNIKPCRFRPAILIVLHIDIMDDLRESSQRFVLDAKRSQQRFERAILSVMAEFRSEYVERDCV